jgi:urease accessory protein UreH
MKKLINGANKNYPTHLNLQGWNISKEAYQVTDKLASIRVYRYGKRVNKDTGEIMPNEADLFIPIGFVQDLHAADLVNIECTMSSRHVKRYVKRNGKYKEINVLEPLFMVKEIGFIKEKRTNEVVKLNMKGKPKAQPKQADPVLEPQVELPA